MFSDLAGIGWGCSLDEEAIVHWESLRSQGATETRDRMTVYF